MDARDTGQSRQDFLVNDLISRSVFGFDAQNVIRVACHEITFLNFGVPPHRFLETIQKLLGLAVKRNAYDSDEPLIAVG